MSLKDVFNFEQFHLGDLWDRIKEDPKRLLLGVDPLSTKVWNGVLNRDDKPLVDQLGGPYGGHTISAFDNKDGEVYQRAKDAGINTEDPGQLHDIAHVIAGKYGLQGIAGSMGMEGNVSMPNMNQQQQQAEEQSIPPPVMNLAASKGTPMQSINTFDPNEYRQRLNLALDPRSIGVNVGAVPPARIEPAARQQMQPSVVPQVPQEAPKTPDMQPLMNLAANYQQGSQGAAPGGSMRTPDFNPNAQSQAQTSGKKFSVVPEGFDPEIPKEKLKDIKTSDDLINAMPDKRANEYLDWWEKQNGEINDKYDQLSKQFDIKDDKRMSRKEKFGLLMQFGLHLMRNSASDRYGGDLGSALGTSASDTVQDYQRGVATREYKRQGNLKDLEAHRTRDMEKIGTHGDAIMRQSELDERQARKKNLEAKQPNGDGSVVETDQGLFYRQGGNLSRMTDPDTGKPLSRTKPVTEKENEFDKDIRHQEMEARSGKTDRDMFQQAEKEARDQLGKQSEYMAGEGEPSYSEALKTLTDKIYGRYKKFGARGGNLRKNTSNEDDPLGLF